MKKLIATTAIALFIAGCDAPSTSETATSAPKATAELGTWGVDLTAISSDVTPGEDFFRYANGTWLDSYELKPDEARFGSFNALRDRSEERVKTIIDELTSTDQSAGSVEQKVGDYFASYTDLETRNAKGITPLQPILDSISAIGSLDDLVEAFGRADIDGTTRPISAGISIDRKNPDRYLLSMGQGGLGLPDKSYYLDDSERFQGIRAAYKTHIATMLGFTGLSEDEAAAKADAILALETKVAENHWERADLRNRDKTYNLTQTASLGDDYPGFDWARFLTASQYDGAVDVNVSTPSVMAPTIELITNESLETWKDYLTFHAVRNHASVLSEEIDQAAFEFVGKVLRGQQEQRDLWKRAVARVGGRTGLGEALGQIYVNRYFPPEAKAAMDELVENLRSALRLNIEGLDWMGEETKAEAYKKLESFRPKIGYPDAWETYEDVTIVKGDLMANVMSVRAFNHADSVSRISAPTDKDEWFMTPQTVNAYYNPPFNEIVFPAAILQPPFFDPNADPAVNYGAIGGVIGHEMGHGFDDQGSKSDYAGIQRNWWTESDRANFDQRGDALVAQYEAFCPIEGECVDGRLTLGENIGDLGGLSMAYTAYKLSLGGKEAPVIDGLTGDQRFFLGWAQVWRGKAREAFLLRQLKSDPHSPTEFRVNGVVRNMDQWYAAFDVDENDPMYLPPEERVSIW